jgi:uncharacterized protein (TIGR00369 family)
MPSRTRTFSWHDPNETINAVRAMGGRRMLEAIVSGKLSMAPCGHLIDFQLVSLGQASAILEFTPAEFHYNLIGGVHGGVVSTLLDSAMACAILSSLPEDRIHTTLEFKVNFVRGISVEIGRMRSEGQVVHLGKRVATAEARMTDRNGRLYAHATTTCLITQFPRDHTDTAASS